MGHLTLMGKSDSDGELPLRKIGKWPNMSLGLHALAAKSVLRLRVIEEEAGRPVVVAIARQEEHENKGQCLVDLRTGAWEDKRTQVVDGERVPMRAGVGYLPLCKYLDIDLGDVLAAADPGPTR